MGRPRWRRIDLNLELHWSDNWGWIIADEVGTLLSLSWDVEKEAQGSLPTTGIWVGRKGPESLQGR
jgi:hypothetical protein